MGMFIGNTGLEKGERIIYCYGYSFKRARDQVHCAKLPRGEYVR